MKKILLTTFLTLILLQSSVSAQRTITAPTDGNDVINAINTNSSSTISISKITNDSNFETLIKSTVKNCPSSSSPGDCLYNITYLEAVILGIESSTTFIDGIFTESSLANFSFSVELITSGSSQIAWTASIVQVKSYDSNAGESAPTSCDSSLYNTALTSLRTMLNTEADDMTDYLNTKTGNSVGGASLKSSPESGSSCVVQADNQPSSPDVSVTQTSALNVLIYHTELNHTDTSTGKMDHSGREYTTFTTLAP